jgi:hypothetical protein
MSYQPDLDTLLSRHWFKREPVRTIKTLEHVPFPIIDDEGDRVCLCRECTPAADAEHEDKIQTVYVKAIEHFLEEHGLHIIA